MELRQYESFCKNCGRYPLDPHSAWRGRLEARERDDAQRQVIGGLRNSLFELTDGGFSLHLQIQQPIEMPYVALVDVRVRLRVVHLI